MVRAKKSVLLAATALSAIALLGGSPTANAAVECAQMDMYRQPDTYVYLNYGRDRTWTKIEPHGTYMRAVIARYQSGLHYYYGAVKYNNFNTCGVPGATCNRSYVSASNGSFVNNYYQPMWDSGTSHPRQMDTFTPEYKVCGPRMNQNNGS